MELEEVYGHERERHQTSEGPIQLNTHHPSRRQLLNRSPLQTDEDVNTPAIEVDTKCTGLSKLETQSHRKQHANRNNKLSFQIERENHEHEHQCAPLALGQSNACITYTRTV